MYCPECGAEFREGFIRCSDCGETLVAEPPEEDSGPDPDLEVVTVFESADPFAAACARDALQEAGIPFAETGDEIGVRLAICPQIMPVYRIQVGSDREAEARSLLQSLAATQDDEQG